MPDQILEQKSEYTPVRQPSPDSRSTSKNQKWIWAVVAVVVVGAAIFYYLRESKQRASSALASAPVPRGVPVSTAAARKGDIGVYINALGTVTPVYTDTITSRVQGEIVNVYYREGQLVHKGDPLLDIDARPYQAQLTEVEGQLAHDQALLNEARIDLSRYQSAFAQNAIAKQQVDDQEQTVLQFEGTVKNDQGQVENAKVNLVYCHITSPIDGRVGLRLVDPGNIIQANSTTVLVVVTQLQPITVIFSVAEDYLPQIQTQMRKGQRMLVDAFDRDQQIKLASGYLLTLDNQIDPTTGTLKLKAEFTNDNSSLFANQFVNARLLVNTTHDAILIPTAAIQRNAQGAFVYIIKPDQTATIRTITVGTTDGDTAAVQGLQPGETIAVKGFEKLQDGVKVAVQGKPSGTSERQTP
ncbi:MAG TPA: efflux RND transporter periplasmic adaptor subunit [Candidatus Acidoferrales bacterium]|jgi:multidrug efflux system membrane fusion protein|nr:efflux RND transporter periplasmic adaptor subunit [Candidatus Acidoferrales bacterium]